MRELSSSAHRVHTWRAEHQDVLIDALADDPLLDDAVLPAAAHLTGPGALDVLGTTVRAVGGVLASARPCHVRYRPGADLVVRYHARVAWGGADPVTETLLAATTRHGNLPGTVPLVAETDAGEMRVGVWRWPFDPLLAGLGEAVTPTGVARLLAEDPDEVRLEVVAYRPAERAVVRVTRADGRVRYLKVVAPGALGALVERHDRLRAAGVPVPAVVTHDPELGVLVTEELKGETLRVRLKSGTGPWPPAAEFRRIGDVLASAELPFADPVRSRLSDAIGHAAMLREILPAERDRLDEMCSQLVEARARSDARTRRVIHGDLYEAQVIVVGDRITGVLDVDDVGPGDPVDDPATLLGHLRYRATITSGHGGRIAAYADALRHDLVAGGAEYDVRELDTVTGAVLIGLATGPFRIQQRRWADGVRRHLDTAQQLLRGTRRRARDVNRDSRTGRDVTTAPAREGADR